jgi:hypothetical protein
MIGPRLHDVVQSHQELAMHGQYGLDVLKQRPVLVCCDHRRQLDAVQLDSSRHRVNKRHLGLNVVHQAYEQHRNHKHTSNSSSRICSLR